VRKPSGHQELGEELVEVERTHEESGALVELGLPRFDSSSSVRMSMLSPVSWEARRTFCPRRPIASESCSSGTTTSMRSASSSMTTLETSAGWRAFTRKVGMSSFQGNDVDLLARSSFTTACTRLPRMPTQAPTGSMELS
jgi:hypothetical protein